MAVLKKLQKEKPKLELIWHLAEVDPSEAERQINRAFDILFESVLADSQPQPQTV